MKSLPKRMKPSALIRLALADLAKVERAKATYEIDMGAFHQANGKCAVCFAGAVIAGTLGVPPNRSVDAHDFDDLTANRLWALDAFRCGYVTHGLEEFYGPDFVPPSDVPEMVHIPGYSPARRVAFKRAMRSLATKLEKAGL